MFLRLSLPSLCRLPSLGGIVLAALAALVPRPAAAEAPSGGTPSQATPDAVARAESLFREGREAMRVRDYTQACEKFRESDALDPSPGTRLNWALCSEATGHLAQALEHARWALDRLASDDDRRPIAARLAAGLESRVPTLTLRLAPDSGPDARVYLDDAPLAIKEGERTLLVDPGEHTVVVEEPTRPSASYLVVLHEGDALSQIVAAGAPWRWRHEREPGGEAAGARRAAAPGEARQRTRGYVAIGVAGLLAGAGLVAWRVQVSNAAIYDDNGRCLQGNQTRGEQCGSYATRANVALGVEIGAFATASLSAALGTWLLWTAQAPSSRLSTPCTPWTLGVLCTKRF